MRVLAGSYPNTVRLQLLSDIRMSDHIIRRRWLFNEPRLERLQLLHILHSLRDVPDLYASARHYISRTVRIDHQDTPSRPGILVFDSLGINLSVLRHVRWVIDDTPDQTASSEIVLRVSTDLELLISGV